MSAAVHRITNKRRAAGSHADATARALQQGGGVKAVAEESGIKARRLYAAADPQADHGDKPLTWPEVFRLERDLGLTAFSDALVALHGGVVLGADEDRRDVSVLKTAFVEATQRVTLALLENRPESAREALDAALKAGAALRAALNREGSR